MRRALIAAVAALALPVAVQAAEHEKMAARARTWLARQQYRDGHWQGRRGDYKYPAKATALAGLALLMQGSNLHSGRYAEQLTRATDWLLAQAQPDGLLCNPDGESIRCMFAHGYALLFLAQVYGEEEDADRHRKLRQVLERAVRFTLKVQTSRGGWGRNLPVKGTEDDEADSTVVQVQALQAAREAGLSVPPEALRKARDFLAKSTDDKGGIGGWLLPTAGALAGCFGPGDLNTPLARKWLKFCQDHATAEDLFPRRGEDIEAIHFYFAQVAYRLGDTGYARLFPDSKESERLTWTDYRHRAFRRLSDLQRGDGSWDGEFGPVPTTALYLCVLQLEHNFLPLLSRP